MTPNPAGRYFVWTVPPRGRNPVDGFGPYANQARVRTHARIKAKKGRMDVVVTTDPTRPNFRVVRRYAARTGETKVRG